MTGLDDFLRLHLLTLVRNDMQTEIIQLTHVAAPKQAQFGEFLVAQQALDRFQLFRALQMQDRVPDIRLGQCAVALGFAPLAAIEGLHARFARLGSAHDGESKVDDLSTEAFERVHEIEAD